MSRATDLAVLLAQENRVLSAMINVRYAVENSEQPKWTDLNAIREVSGRFATLAVKIYEEEEKKEADRRASEY